MTMYDHDRIGKLQSKLTGHQMEGCLITQNVDLFYFTGTMQSGYLFGHAEGSPIFYVLRSAARAVEEAGVAVKPLGSFRTFGSRLADDFPSVFKEGSRPLISADLDVLPVQTFRRLEKMLPDIQWADGSRLIREIRMIKSEREITAIRNSAVLTDRALEYALERLTVGMSELEFISLIEYVMRKGGHSGLMRMRGYNQELVTGMVVSGSAAARPTYFDGPAGGQGLSPAFPLGSGHKRIKANEPILIDIGCCVDGYVIDQTRTAVIGRLDDELLRAYDTAEAIMKATERLLKPGAVCEELYFGAVRQAEAAGLAGHFMGYGADQVKFLGHGIGLEVDEFPVLAGGFSYPLQPGMVIAVEPKFTFPGRGVVGIENTYAITDDGFEKLTISREGLIHIT